MRRRSLGGINDAVVFLNFIYNERLIFVKAVLSDGKSGTLNLEKYRFSHRKVPLFGFVSVKLLIFRQLYSCVKRLRNFITFLGFSLPKKGRCIGVIKIGI